MNNSELDNLINGLSKKLNTSPQQLKSNLEKGNLDPIVNNLDSTKMKKIKKIIDDPKESEKILNSPQAQAIIKKLMS